MSAITAIPSAMTFISDHAIVKFVERVDSRLDPNQDREAICLLLRRMYRCSRVATETQLRMMHIRIEWTATYRLSDTSFGLYLLIIQGGCLKTLWKIEQR